MKCKKPIFTAILAAVVAVSGCGKRSNTEFTPVGKGECKPAELEEGAVLKSASLFGFTGAYEAHTYFADGRGFVARHPSYLPAYPGKPDVTVRIEPARVAKLMADLEGARIFAEPQGCWRPTYRGSDGGWGRLVVRHGGRLFVFDSSGGEPPTLRETWELVDSLDAMVQGLVREREMADAAADGGASSVQ